MRRRSARRRPERLARWYRVVPVCLLALSAALLALFAATPTTLARAAFFPVDHADAIRASAERHGVDPLLACAVISCESGWDEGAVSSAGAVGLMQVMPETASSLVGMGLVDGAAYDPAALADPDTNIEFGCAYLGYLQENLSSFDEVIAAYNAGIGAVSSWIAEGGTIPDDVRYAETRAYLQRVRAAYDGYRWSYPDGLAGA